MRLFLAALTAMTLALCSPAVQAQGFSYQGVLTDNGSPANGTYDVRARIIDPATMLPNGSDQINSVTVTDGLFTTIFQFRFPSNPNTGAFLDIAVRQGVDPFTELSHELVLPTPYAWYAFDGDLEQISGHTLYNDGSLLGVNVPSPLAPLHVRKSDLNLGPQSLLSSNTTMIIENEDSVLDIVSKNSGLSSGIILLRDVDSGGNFLDAWTFVKRTLNGGAWLDLNYSTGGVAIPAQRLYPDGRVVMGHGTDVALGNAGGTLVLGDENGKNLGIDDNEIMARDGAGPALLGLNVEGGDVLIGDENSTAEVPGDLVVGGDARRSQPVLRSLLLTQSDFIDGGSLDRQRDSIGIGVTPVPLSAIAYAPIDLPDGAVIKAVSALVRDNDDELLDDVRMQLFTQGFTTTSTQIEIVQTSGDPGLTLLEFVTNLTVDKDNADVFLEFRFTNNFLLSQSSKRLYSVEIQYETDSVR